MKTYKIDVQYSFNAEFIISADTEKECSTLVMTKVKALSGSINTFNLQIQEWAMTTRPVDTRIIKITEVK